MKTPIHLRLPATSANLGPGFDALGIAMALYLTIEAREASDTRIESTGRNAHTTARTDRNLILATYCDVLAKLDRHAPPLHLRLHNEIPLGMGCGSSAAALLAGVHLANHFGGLGWSAYRVMREACLREGHPDNVAACALGGMTASCQVEQEVQTATFAEGIPWKLMLAIPGTSLATERARALLPTLYPRADAVANVQRVALLVAAFAQQRPELLRAAMQDRIHQPYRSEACPLLPRLLPLGARVPGVWGVALSGAGPSILLIVDPQAPEAPVRQAVQEAALDTRVELLTTGIAGATKVTI
jgi:homoserine kinase